MRSNVPYKMKNRKLTGKTRHRIGKENVSMFTDREVLVLQVEVEYERWSFCIGLTEHLVDKLVSWEDARVQDFSLDIITSL